MSCVSPSSSVSQQVPKTFDISALSALPLPGFTSELLAKLSGAEVIEVIKLHYDACVRVAEAVGSVAGSTTSVVTSSVSDSGHKSSTTSRPNSRARRRARRIASKSEIGFRSASPVVGVSSYDAGYCYLELFPEVSWPDIAAKYGTYPVLATLLTVPMSELISEVKLLALPASVGDRCVHVGQGNVSFISLCAGAMLQDSIEPVVGTLSSFCTWRDGVSVSSAVSVGALPLTVAIPPLQYLSLFVYDRWASVYIALGSSPTLAQLMSLDKTWYSDRSVARLLSVDVLPDRIQFSPGGTMSFYEVSTALCHSDVERVWSVGPSLMRLDPLLLGIPVMGISHDTILRAKADFSTNVHVMSAHLSDSSAYVKAAYSDEAQIHAYQFYGRSVLQAVVCALLSRAQIAWIPPRWDRFHSKFEKVFNRSDLAKQLVSGTAFVGNRPSYWLYFSLALLFDSDLVGIIRSCQDLGLQQVVVDTYHAMVESLPESLSSF